jgi:hypothetical protein
MILKTDHTRVSRAIREFKTSGIILDTLRSGRPQKATSELGPKWEPRSVAQLKNRWCCVVEHRVQTHLGDVAMLTSVFERGRRGLPIPQLAPDYSEVIPQLNGKGIVKWKVGRKIPY